MKFLLILLSSLWLVPKEHTLKVGHEFYVSTTELRVDEQNERLTAVMQVFPDDWERAMNAILAKDQQRYIQLTEAQKDSLHERELVRTFKVNVPETLPLQYVGSETTTEYTRLYFTLGPVELSSVESWDIAVSTLADIFPSQENIITFYQGTERQTNSCREGNNYHLEF